ncbi:MAG: hypothetical protein JNM07_03330 [Phycisphaerae bacterium]|nr:hypothetical protein [Phycisphaerae bacterium]
MTSLLAACMAIGAAGAGVPDAIAPPTEGAKVASPALEGAPAEDPGLPSLDELLGLPPTRGGASRQADELDRLLSGRTGGQGPSALLIEATRLMEVSARRLEPGGGPAGVGDTSLETQRTQEEAVRALDTLIAQAERKGSPSSSRSSSRQRQPQDTTSKPSPSDRQTPTLSRADAQGEPSLPGRQDGSLRPTIEAARASWGALPSRVRAMLMQGSGDRYSALYERLTEEYYKRLAQERGEER